MSYGNGIGSLQRTDSGSQVDVSESVQPKRHDKAVQADVSSAADVGHAVQANLSSTGGLVAQALGSSDVQSQKVASLQQAIAAGQYKISSSDVADKLLQSLLDS